MIVEGYEIHDEWEESERKDFNFNGIKSFSLMAKLDNSELSDDKFEYMVYFTDGVVMGCISDKKGQNVYFDDYEETEKYIAPEYDFMDDGTLQFKFDIKMSPKSVLARLKEIANSSKYLLKIVGKKKYLC